MSGDDHRRFCEECGKHVHNVSAMSSRERAEFAKPANRNECIILVHRADGTLVDLSLWAKLRRGFPLLRLVRWSALAALLPSVLTACGGRRLSTVGMVGMPCGPQATSAAHAFEGSQSPPAIPVPPGVKYETTTPEK